MKNLSGIYNCFRQLLNISDAISNEQMNEQIIKYYFDHKKVNEYGWCHDTERQTLAILYDVILGLVCVRRDESVLTVKFYGERLLMGKKIIYMLYDESKCDYRSLHVLNKEDSTALNYITENLRTYIADKLNYNDQIDFEDMTVDNPSSPKDGEKTNAMEIIPDSTLMVTSLIREESSEQTSQTGIDDLPMHLNDNKRLLPSISNEDDGPNKRMKVTEDSEDDLGKSNKSHLETRVIEEPLQANPSMALTDEYQEEKEIQI